MYRQRDSSHHLHMRSAKKITLVKESTIVPNTLNFSNFESSTIRNGSSVSKSMKEQALMNSARNFTRSQILGNSTKIGPMLFNDSVSRFLSTSTSLFKIKEFKSFRTSSHTVFFFAKPAMTPAIRSATKGSPLQFSAISFPTSNSSSGQLSFPNALFSNNSQLSSGLSNRRLRGSVLHFPCKATFFSRVVNIILLLFSNSGKVLPEPGIPVIEMTSRSAGPLVSFLIVMFVSSSKPTIILPAVNEFLSTDFSGEFTTMRPLFFGTFSSKWETSYLISLILFMSLDHYLAHLKGSVQLSQPYVETKSLYLQTLPIRNEVAGHSQHQHIFSQFISSISSTSNGKVFIERIYHQYLWFLRELISRFKNELLGFFLNVRIFTGEVQGT
ncbi:hypothetical protein H5410_030151 [Solanum commersonii]|uniref:Uncharacterized protein n=1 Tax=Solanum commersonii TaxID=4109 RepID=A0A9J5YFB1_SOLCO|nr:hypothetical protein H5410_030151 [Solanum commersonii]